MIINISRVVKINPTQLCSLLVDFLVICKIDFFSHNICNFFNHNSLKNDFLTQFTEANKDKKCFYINFELNIVKLFLEIKILSYRAL